MILDEITLIRLEYNSINGFIFELLRVEIQGKTKSFSGDLFGVYFAESYFIVNILFFSFDIKSPFIK